MKLTRRALLTRGAAGLAGLILAPGVLSPLFTKLTQADSLHEVDPESYDWGDHYYGFLVDTTRCIGCGKCMVACKLENHVPNEPDCNRTWIERYVISEDGEVFVDSPDGGIGGFSSFPENIKYRDVHIAQSFFVPKLCNQCDNPPCVQVCPVGATYMTKDGIVLVDQKRCIGCRYCIQACPYGARYLVPPHADVTPQGQTGVADKCTWCYHRITKGLLPACVEACPVNARIFGDMRDPDSAPRKALRDARVYTLKPALGTKPKVYYIGLNVEVR
ncbi:MAG: 4Fe-4S dicluster domain-containing protein [Dehalococcoidia bacterium]|nr:4Fe-4S dicluster domain-containing protein [Dehalococcoidia bacterium]